MTILRNPRTNTIESTDSQITIGGTGGVSFSFPSADGTNGQALVTDGAGVLSFASAGPGSDEWEGLSSQTASAVANIDFTLSAGFRAFRVYFFNVIPVNNDVGFFVRVSNDGGSSFLVGGGYRSAANGSDSLVTPETEGAHNLGFWGLTEDASINRGVGNAANEGATGVFHITKPLEATLRTRMFGQIQYTSAANTEWIFMFGGAHNTIETHNAIRFLFQSGNISSGEFVLQGLKN